jgi:hypothetical protein
MAASHHNQIRELFASALDNLVDRAAHADVAIDPELDAGDTRDRVAQLAPCGT